MKLSTSKSHSARWKLLKNQKALGKLRIEYKKKKTVSL